MLKKLAVLIFTLYATSTLAATTLKSELKKITKGNPEQRLEKLFEIYWNHEMEVSPEWATYVGIPGHNDKWSDNSPAAIAAERQNHRDFLAAIKSIPSASFHGETEISYLLFLRDMEYAVEGDSFPGELIAIDQMSGPHSMLPDILVAAPRSTEKDYLDRVTRLQHFDVTLDQTIALLQEGLKKGITNPQVTLRDVPTQVSDLITDPVENSPLFETFKDIKADLSAAKKTEIQNQAKKAIKEVVYPSLKKLRDFLTTVYIPGARTTISFSDLPDGERWYRFNVKATTTTSLTPDEIHNIGVTEVTRIRHEMDAIREKMKFKGDFKAFNEYLRSDAKFFYTTEADLLSGYRDIAKRIDPELPRLFGHLPRNTYGVREMPPFKAKSAPAAYYEGGSLEAGRAGYFTANTYDLKSRPKWDMEDLTLHEAVPGHHLQVSIAQEMEHVPEFRKQGSYTAFTEGWALYCETIGEELGLLKDPLAKYGQLNAEIWRAIRLVVDTGLHSQHWTRDQVVQYIRDNSAITEHDIQAETDRYIVWPSQALAYKVGQMKIREMRSHAELTLGDKFSIRDFHDQLLGSGSLPLDVIEKKMTAWMGLRSKHTD